MSQSATAHYRTIGYCRKPGLSQRRSVKRSSLGQSISIDMSPILGSPESTCSDATPKSESSSNSSFSVASSAYSTASKLASAKIKAKKQRKELKTIRRKSKNVQEYLLDRLQETENHNRYDTTGLDFYEQELEKMKDSLCSLTIGENLFRSNSEGDRTDCSAQLASIQREVRAIRDCLAVRNNDIKQREREREALQEAVRTLEKTVLELNGAEEEPGRKKDANTCNCLLM